MLLNKCDLSHGSGPLHSDFAIGALWRRAVIHPCHPWLREGGVGWATTAESWWLCGNLPLLLEVQRRGLSPQQRNGQMLDTEVAERRVQHCEMVYKCDVMWGKTAKPAGESSVGESI
jgi:hypothetical protein